MFFQFLLLFLVLYALNNHFLNKIRNLPPSPFPTLPIIGHPHLIKKPLHRSLAKISSRHGPVLLLQLGSRRVLLVSSPSAAEECFTKNDVIFANRPRLLAGKHLGYNFTSLAWAPYGESWRNLRKISSLELLSSHRLHLLSEIRRDEVRLLIRRLSGRQDRTVDLNSAFFELMLNVMMRMIAGKRYYGDDAAEDAEEARMFQELVAETFQLGSSMADYLPGLLVAITGAEKRFVECQRKRDGFVQALIEQHRKRMRSESDGNNNKTLIDVLLSLQESEPEFYKDQVIRSLMLALLSAGTDTSVGTLEWAMSLLLNNPEVLKKAQNEIDKVIGHDCLLNEPDIARLPYLNCIITETMRMYPAGPLLVPHESSEKCIVGGYRIPRGTMLFVNMWAIQNDPRIWEDPTRFKPERFRGFEGTKDGFRLMPFGAGRRGCPGEGLAMRMIGLALGSLLQCFEWERVGAEMVDMTEGAGLTLRKVQPLVVKCNPRPFMLNLMSQI